MKLEIVDLGEGRLVQKCPFKKCDYVSPIITNGKTDVMSAGLKLHLQKTHKGGLL